MKSLSYGAYTRTYALARIRSSRNRYSRCIGHHNRIIYRTFAHSRHKITQDNRDNRVSNTITNSFQQRYTSLARNWSDVSRSVNTPQSGDRQVQLDRQRQVADAGAYLAVLEKKIQVIRLRHRQRFAFIITKISHQRSRMNTRTYTQDTVYMNQDKCICIVSSRV